VERQSRRDVGAGSACALRGRTGSGPAALAERSGDKIPGLGACTGHEAKRARTKRVTSSNGKYSARNKGDEKDQAQSRLRPLPQNRSSW
jgi:hypothetical protein